MRSRTALRIGLGLAAAVVLTALMPIATNSASTTVADTTWVESAKLEASDGEEWDYFGETVAIDGDTLAVATTGWDFLTPESGSVYVLKRTRAGWEEVTELRGSGAGASDWFGVSIIVDSDMIVVGAPKEDSSVPFLKRAGAVYVFTRSGSDWLETARLTPSDLGEEDSFGHSVAWDGESLLIGASGHGEAGAAYVFTVSGNEWTESAKLTAFDGEDSDYFGHPVAIGKDTIAVGASGDDDTGFNHGSVYLLERTRSGWEHSSKLTASDGPVSFGASLEVSGDTVAVGSLSGVYLFDKIRTRWVETVKLFPTDHDDGDWFGRSLALKGAALVVGALRDDGHVGAAYVFTRDRTGWTESAKLTPSDGEIGDYFGKSVALDGTTIVIGAWGHDSASEDTGAAYVFALKRGP